MATRSSPTSPCYTSPSHRTRKMTPCPETTTLPRRSIRKKVPKKWHDDDHIHSSSLKKRRITSDLAKQDHGFNTGYKADGKQDASSPVLFLDEPSDPYDADNHEENSQDCTLLVTSPTDSSEAPVPFEALWNSDDESETTQTSYSKNMLIAECDDILNDTNLDDPLFCKEAYVTFTKGIRTSLVPVHSTFTREQKGTKLRIIEWKGRGERFNYKTGETGPPIANYICVLP